VLFTRWQHLQCAQILSITNNSVTGAKILCFCYCFKKIYLPASEVNTNNTAATSDYNTVIHWTRTCFWSSFVFCRRRSSCGSSCLCSSTASLCRVDISRDSDIILSASLVSLWRFAVSLSTYLQTQNSHKDHVTHTNITIPFTKHSYPFHNASKTLVIFCITDPYGAYFSFILLNQSSFCLICKLLVAQQQLHCNYVYDGEQTKIYSM